MPTPLDPPGGALDSLLRVLVVLLVQPSPLLESLMTRTLLPTGRVQTSSAAECL